MYREDRNNWQWYPKRKIWVRSYDAGIDLERRYRWGAGDEGDM